MKKVIIFLIIALTYSASLAQYVDDLYALPETGRTKEARQERQRQKRENEAYRLQQEEYARKQELFRQQAQYVQQPTETQSELVTTIDEAFKRRAQAMNAQPMQSPSTRAIADGYRNMLEKKYNQDLYAVVSINDQTWVEPRYINSLFNGSEEAIDGMKNYEKSLASKNQSTAQNVTNVYNIYPSSGVNVNVGYGWGGYYGNPWRWGGYSPWPYNPWYSPVYSPWYDPWYNPGYYPIYRPIYVPVRHHPVYYGNTINGNGYNHRYNDNRYYTGGGGGGMGTPAPSTRPGYNGNNQGNNNNYNPGLGGGQRPNNQQPVVRPQERPETRPSYTPSQNTRPSGGGIGQGFGGSGGGGNSGGGGGGGFVRR